MAQCYLELSGSFRKYFGGFPRIHDVSSGALPAGGWEYLFHRVHAAWRPQNWVRRRAL